MAAAGTLDFSRPVAVLLLSVLHLVPDDAQAGQVVTRLMAGCVPGSHLTISHPASDIDADQTAEATRRLNQARPGPGAPGLVPVPKWRPRSELESSSPAALWAAVARKP